MHPLCWRVPLARAQCSASGLCGTPPQEGSSSQQRCRWGDTCFICHNGWQSWGAAGGLLLFDLIQLCVLWGSLTQPPPSKTRTQPRYVPAALSAGVYLCTLLVGSPVSNLCHIYHHPKPLGSLFSLPLSLLSLL